MQHPMGCKGEWRPCFLANQAREGRMEGMGGERRGTQKIENTPLKANQPKIKSCRLHTLPLFLMRKQTQMLTNQSYHCQPLLSSNSWEQSFATPHFLCVNDQFRTQNNWFVEISMLSHSTSSSFSPKSNVRSTSYFQQRLRPP